VILHPVDSVGGGTAKSGVYLISGEDRDGVFNREIGSW
jgi:hypothetical protein